MAYFALPTELYPNITPPTVQVTASYPGANAVVVANTVAAPIEQQVNGVERMLYMSSQSTNDGNYTLTVTFEIGTDVNIAQVLVQNRVALALPQLPPQVQLEGVNTKKTSPDILLAINLLSPDRRYDSVYMSNFATIQLKDELLRIKGVGDIIMLGQRDYSMRLWLDPERLATRSLTASDVITAIQNQNVQVAAGAVGQQPVPAGQPFQLTMSALGRLDTERQFGDIILKTGAPSSSKTNSSAGSTSGPSSPVVYVRDVARVELGAQTYDQTATADGKPSAGMAVFLLPGANALEVADAIKQRMKELKSRFPPGLEYDYLLRHHAVHPAVRRGSGQHAPDRGPAGGRGRAVLPAGLEGHDPAHDRRARLPGRHVRRHGGPGLQPEQPDPVRAGAGHRHRRGRRHHGAGKHRAPDGDGPGRAHGHHQGHGRTDRPDRRHYPGAQLRVLAELLHPRPDRPVLPPVRPDHRRLGDHFGRQRHDPDPLARRLHLQDRGEQTPAARETRASRHPQKEALPWWIFGIVGGLLTAWLAPRFLAGHLGLPAASAEEASSAQKWLYWGATFAPGLLVGLAAGWFLIGPVNAVLGSFFRGFNRLFDGVTAAYGWTVGKLLRLSVIVLVVYGGLLGLTWWRVASAPTGFIPTQDQGYLLVNVQLPDTASVQRTDAVLARIDQTCPRRPRRGPHRRRLRGIVSDDHQRLQPGHDVRRPEAIRAADTRPSTTR